MERNEDTFQQSSIVLISNKTPVKTQTDVKHISQYSFPGTGIYILASHQILTHNCFSSRLAVVFAESIEARY